LKGSHSITINPSVYYEFCKIYPKAQHNFSAGVEAALLSVINNPKKMWAQQMTFYQELANHARDQVIKYKAMEDQIINERVKKELEEEMLH